MQYNSVTESYEEKTLGKIPNFAEFPQDRAAYDECAIRSKLTFRKWHCHFSRKSEFLA